MVDSGVFFAQCDVFTHTMCTSAPNWLLILNIIVVLVLFSSQLSDTLHVHSMLKDSISHAVSVVQCVACRREPV